MVPNASSVGDWTAWLIRHAALLSRIAAYGTAMLIVAPFFFHLAHGSTAYLGLLEDDYFYYAAIADKLVTLGKITYDGVTLTNGFHPLWFAIIALLRWVSGGFGVGYYVGFALICLVSIIATYELTRRFAIALGASAILGSALAAVYLLGAGRLLATGMECTVAVPLMLWLLVEIAKPIELTSTRAAKLGFIASLAVLGRLDIGIAVILLVAGFFIFVRPPFKTSLRYLAAFGLGGILVPLYVIANYVVFDSLVPISAIAKRLQTAWGFDLHYALAVAFDTFYGPTIGIVLPLGLIALLRLMRRDSGRQSRALFAGGLALAFAFVFFGLNALSGWIFFGWYAFPLQAATIAALVFICIEWRSLVANLRLQTGVLAVLVALTPMLGVRYYLQHGPWWTVADNSLLAMSYDLKEHVSNRNGVFAMGAMAGVVGYVTGKPIVQVEGIVADRAMVEHRRRQDSLQTVLREYHADYLVVSLAGMRASSVDGCYLVQQPNPQWAGKRTAMLQGEICSEPVERFTTPGGKHSWSAFPELETLVWDLRDARWKQAGGTG